MTAIFQTETTALESQVLALQAQIAAHTERITLLSEAESVAGGSLEVLKGAIQKVSALAPDAIATLRRAVLDLFRGDSSDDGGNQPILPAPNPQPGFDNRTLHELALDACREYAQEQASAPQPELTGQSCEWASPLTSPLASPLSSWLCCQLEDAPSAALTGQLVEIACVLSDAPQQEAYVELISVTHLVAYQRRQAGEIICCYVGGNNKARLKDWGSWLCTQHSVGSGFEVRKAERMTAYNHELKIWGMSLKQIQRLAETDTTKTPPSRYHTASFPVAAHLLQIDEDVPQAETEEANVVIDHEVEAVLAEKVKLELAAEPVVQGFQVGDKVKIVSDRHGAELVGLTGIVTAGTAAGAAVNVGGNLRWLCSDEVTLIQASPTSRNAVDDLLPTAPAPTYNANPIGGGGARANWKARQAAGIGVNLKDCGTGGITTLEEWRRIEADQKAQQATAVAEEQDIQEGDWVELLVNGDRYQVDSVDSEGVYLITEDGNAYAQADEVKLLFRAPSDWKPF